MSLQVKEVIQSETVEVVIKNINSRQYKFSDNETSLDQIVLHGIAVHTDAVGKSFTGVTIMPVASIKKGFLTLSNPQNEQPLKRMPLETLLQNQNFILFIKPRIIDVRKSFVDFPSSADLILPDAAGYSVLFTMFYEKFDPVKHAKIGEE